jgi:hypothetical protein
VTHLDETMRRFGELPGSSIGRGPQHPVNPDPDVAPQVEQFFQDYPALRNDPEYVEFMEKYAGAGLVNEASTQLIDILGFTDAAMEMDAMDGEIVDDQGFLMIADVVYHLRDEGRNLGTIEHSFAYSLAGARPAGIYHSVVTREDPTVTYARSHERFGLWLEDLVSRAGWFDPPGRPG